MTARRPRALVTNDDGIDSPGLLALAAAARRAGMEVVVAAPAAEASGSSAAIVTTERGGRTVIERRELPGMPEVTAYAVGATPAWIVLAATRGWLDPAPAVVLSGINLGANVGRAVLHSGTVGAALTAGINGARGLAVSLDVGLRPVGSPHWESAAQLVPDLVERLLEAPDRTVLSLNVPDRPVAELRELRPARLAEFGAVQTRVDRVHDDHIAFTVVELESPPEEGSDSAMLAAGHPTLTALESVRAAVGELAPRWLDVAGRRIA